MTITNLTSASGKPYALGKFTPGEYQYQDRHYQFNYIPEQMSGCLHIKTHGNDKLTPEDSECFSFNTQTAVDVYVLYADKFPILPRWLESYERTRLNATRIDSSPDTLKGYFGLYKKRFPAGKVTLYGASPNALLAEDWYVSSGGNGYCMYSVCVKEAGDV